jgi:carboxyl-terminal processing protease
MRTRQSVLIVLFVFLLGVFAARLPAGVTAIAAAVQDKPGVNEFNFFDPLVEIRSIMRREYVDAPDAAKMQQGAIDGMLEVLNDPYTVYIPPTESRSFNKELTGQFVGIGAEVTLEGGFLKIVSPLEDSPAYAAGVQAGDRVIKVDGKSTQNKTVDECIDMLMGEPKTPVTLTIERTLDGQEEPQQLEVTVVRDHIVVRAVRGLRRLEGGEWQYLLDPAAPAGQRVAYLRLSQFTPTAAKEFADTLGALGAARGDLGGLIIDLRGDPGGLLEAALEIADLFLADGKIVSVRGREGDEVVHAAKGPGTLPDFPLMVLVNGGSASASEILAGSLADRNRAAVLGSRSFGKGLVQSVQPLRQTPGAVLKFTSARYYLPSGRLIQRTDDSAVWGVDPTPGFYIPMTAREEIDRLLARRERDILRRGATGAGDDRWTDPAWIASQAKDPQLAGGVKAMLARVAAGPGAEWTPPNPGVNQEFEQASVELTQLERMRDRLELELGRVDKRIDAISTGEPDAARTRRDLWPDDAKLQDGHVDVYDSAGKLVTRLKITGPDLERWLVDAEVEPDLTQTPATDTPTTPANPPAPTKGPAAGEPEPSKKP